MPNDIFTAIDGDSLYNKSKVYVGRALLRKGAGDLDEYQLWASLALELLGKAALSKRHPSLIVDPNDWQSIFVAAGILITTDVKTITAKTLFERLSHFIPKFDKTVLKFCVDLAMRRNAELHSADIPFRTMKLEAWETRFWHASDTILHQMGFSLEQWLGAADATAPRALLDEATKALEAAVKHRVEAAQHRFTSLKKAVRDQLQIDAESRDPQHQTVLFQSTYDKIWTQTCPACSCLAFMGGKQTAEDISEERDEGNIWEVVDREFVGEEYFCIACDLKLVGSDEIDAAGISGVHEDQQERELEYEPDYGND